MAAEPQLAAGPAAFRRTVLASGVRVRRGDGAVLLVRARSGPGAGTWSLPCTEVPEHETAEDAALRLLRDVLRVHPASIQFAGTVSIAGQGTGTTAVDTELNVFDAIEWSGEPRYRDEFDDAGWLALARLAGVDVLPEVAAWLRDEVAGPAEPEPPRELDRAAVAAALVEARTALLAAFDALPVRARTVALDGAWSAADVLAHAERVERYELAEAQRLAAEPGAMWLAWNERQGELERALGPQPDLDAARERIEAAHAETLRALQWLDPAALAVRGWDPRGDTVTVEERLRAIAAHDREHAAQLGAMRLRAEDAP